MRRLRLTTAIVILIGAVIGTGAYAKRRQDNFTFTPKAHHVIYAEWKTDKEGNKTLHGLRVRDVEASGAWTEWAVNRQSERTRLSDHSKDAVTYQPAAFFKSRPNLVRQETVLGRDCFTLDVNGARLTYSPEFGMTPLRFESDSGTVIEALKIY